MSEKNRQSGIRFEPVYIASNNEMDFEEALSQAINEGLASISTIVAPVLRAYLDDAVFYEIVNMKAQSSVEDVRKLEVGLEKMFGVGAQVFEKKILESLCAKLSLKLETGQNLSFSKAVKKAKEAFELTKHKNKKTPHVRTRKA
jgi:hypothetical protein